MRSETRDPVASPVHIQVAIAGPIQREEEVDLRLDAAPHLRLFVVAEAGDLVFLRDEPLGKNLYTAQMFYGIIFL